MVSNTRNSLDGLESWTTDMGGLTTHSKTERLGSGNTRQTVTNPNGSKVITNLTSGRVTTVQMVNTDNSLGKLSTYSYDEFNRVSMVTETDGATQVNAMTNTYNINPVSRSNHETKMCLRKGCWV